MKSGLVAQEERQSAQCWGLRRRLTRGTLWQRPSTRLSLAGWWPESTKPLRTAGPALTHPFPYWTSMASNASTTTALSSCASTTPMSACSSNSTGEASSSPPPPPFFLFLPLSLSPKVSLSSEIHHPSYFPLPPSSPLPFSSCPSLHFSSSFLVPSVAMGLRSPHPDAVALQ